MVKFLHSSCSRCNINNSYHHNFIIHNNTQSWQETTKEQTRIKLTIITSFSKCQLNLLASTDWTQRQIRLPFFYLEHHCWTMNLPSHSSAPSSSAFLLTTNSYNHQQINCHQLCFMFPCANANSWPLKQMSHDYCTKCGN